MSRQSTFLLATKVSVDNVLRQLFTVIISRAITIIISIGIPVQSETGKDYRPRKILFLPKSKKKKEN